MFILSNIQLMKQGIDNNFGRALTSLVIAISYVVIGLVYAWKLALVLLAVLPLISVCGALMYTMSKKYKEKELQAYENAGGIAQNVLTSIKTVSVLIYKRNSLECTRQISNKLNQRLQ